MVSGTLVERFGDVLPGLRGRLGADRAADPDLPRRRTCEARCAAKADAGGQCCLGVEDVECSKATGRPRAAGAVMAGDVDKLKRAIELAICARHNIDAACARVGIEPLSLEELRLISPEFREFERVAPVDWIPLIERAAQGDVEAIELLDVECERADQPVD